MTKKNVSHINSKNDHTSGHHDSYFWREVLKDNALMLCHDLSFHQVSTMPTAKAQQQ
jgi:hypothetical protein